MSFKNYELIKEYLLDNTTEIIDIIYEVNTIDNSLEYLEYFVNDDEFFDNFFHDNPGDAVRCSYFGDYRPYDDYVAFNGYGNLYSINQWQLEEEWKDNIEDIIEKLVKFNNELTLSNTLKDLVENYIKEVKYYEV